MIFNNEIRNEDSITDADIPLLIEKVRSMNEEAKGKFPSLIPTCSLAQYGIEVDPIYIPVQFTKKKTPGFIATGKSKLKFENKTFNYLRCESFQSFKVVDITRASKVKNFPRIFINKGETSFTVEADLNCPYFRVVYIHFGK